jgi:CheY-like chemotaxis protein
VQKPFVLVADDNEATCTLITALLRADFEVEVAHDGSSAIEKLKGRQYAAVILDLLMPRSDGYAVLDFLRDEQPAVLPRLIVVTASVLRREMERVNGYGVCTVLSKPFEIDVLQEKVNECAGRSGPFDARAPLLSTGMLFLLADLMRDRLM